MYSQEFTRTHDKRTAPRARAGFRIRYPYPFISLVTNHAHKRLPLRTHPSSEDWQSVGIISLYLYNLPYVFQVQDTIETLPHSGLPLRWAIKTRSTGARLGTRSSPTTLADGAHSRTQSQQRQNPVYQCGKLTEGHLTPSHNCILWK